MSPLSWSRASTAGGFTLIEVIGALVIFSVGVLMVMQVSGALGTQMRYAGAGSAIQVMASSRLDSLEALPVASLTAGTSVDTVTAGGIEYECTVLITPVTPALKKIDVSMAPTGSDGPSYSVTSYMSEPW